MSNWAFSRLALFGEESFNISAAADDVKDKRICTLDAVEDDVFAGREAAQAWPQVVIAAAAHLRVLAKQKQTLRDSVNQTIGDFYAAATAGNVKPDIIKFRFCGR